MKKTIKVEKKTKKSKIKSIYIKIIIFLIYILMENPDGIIEFTPKLVTSYPSYLYQERDYFDNRKLIGFMRCYDCQGELTLDQADSYMCRKTHQTISRLSNKGWSDRDILKECKRIYGNDIIIRHYDAPPPVFVINK